MPVEDAHSSHCPNQAGKQNLESAALAAIPNYNLNKNRLLAEAACSEVLVTQATSGSYGNSSATTACRTTLVSSMGPHDAATDDGFEWPFSLRPESRADWGLGYAESSGRITAVGSRFPLLMTTSLPPARSAFACSPAAIHTGGSATVRCLASLGWPHVPRQPNAPAQGTDPAARVQRLTQPPSPSVQPASAAATAAVAVAAATTGSGAPPLDPMDELLQVVRAQAALSAQLLAFVERQFRPELHPLDDHRPQSP